MADIARSVTLPSTIDRVWNAIIDSAEFGSWFGAEFDGHFVEGGTTTGRIVPTTIDPDVAAAQEPHRGAPITVEVVSIEPTRRFAFRWHPVPDSDVLTLVEFLLEDEGDVVRLTITEDGFGDLPSEQGTAAREGNDAGWEAQTRLLAGYLKNR